MLLRTPMEACVSEREGRGREGVARGGRGAREGAARPLETVNQRRSVPPPPLPGARVAEGGRRPRQPRSRLPPLQCYIPDGSRA